MSDGCSKSNRQSSRTGLRTAALVMVSMGVFELEGVGFHTNPGEYFAFL